MTLFGNAAAPAAESAEDYQALEENALALATFVVNHYKTMSPQMFAAWGLNCQSKIDGLLAKARAIRDKPVTAL